MTQLTMYPAQVNSPDLTLTSAIDGSTTTIYVTGDVPAKLPTFPNMFVIGNGEDAETIRYNQAPTGASITWTFYNVTRGFQGTPKSWTIGESVSRLFTAYDHDTFKANIVDLESRKIAREEYTANTILAATTTATPVSLTVPASTFVGRKATGNISSMSVAEVVELIQPSMLLSKSGYGAIIYQTSTYADGYTYAVDKDGNVLSSSKRNLNTDHIPIQAAIDYCYNAGVVGYSYGKVLLKCGNYYPTAKITLYFGVTLEGEGIGDSIIKITTDIDVIKHAGFAQIKNVYFQVASALGTYTQHIITIDGSDATTNAFDYKYPTGIFDIHFQNGCANFGGTAIWFKSENDATANNYTIFGVQMERVTFIGKFNYGIYFSSHLNAPRYLSGFIWNRFTDLSFCGPLYTLYQYMPSGASWCEFNSNTFTNYAVNTYDNTEHGMYLDNASNNQFIAYFDCDFSSRYAIDLGSRSAKNYFDIIADDTSSTAGAARFRRDLGTDNIFSVRGVKEKKLLVLDCNNCNVPASNPATISVKTIGTTLFALQIATFNKGASRDVEHLNWVSQMPPEWDDIGYRLPSGTTYYTADTGTGATTTVDAALTETQTGYYIGWTIVNYTLLSSSKSMLTSSAVVTAYTTGTLTHASISGNVVGNEYYLLRPAGYMTAEVKFTVATTENAECYWNLYANCANDGSSLIYYPMIKVATIHAAGHYQDAVTRTAISSPFHIPGRTTDGKQNTIYWELRRGTTGDVLDQAAQFVSVNIYYKTR